MTNIYKFQDLVLKTRKIRGLKTNLYKAEGMRPIIDQGSNFIAGYSDDSESFYEDDLPVVVFGDHTLAVKYIDFPFCVGADGTQILKPNKDIVSAKFLYYSILNKNIKSLGYSRHFKVLKECIFKILPLETQKRIVARLDEADQLRRKRKQAIALLDDYLKAVFLEMFGDLSGGDEELRKYIKVVGGAAFKSRDFVDDGVPVVKIGTVNKGWFDLSKCSYLPSSYLNDDLRYKKYQLGSGDLLMSLTGTVGKDDYGNVCKVPAQYAPCLLNQRVAKIQYDSSLILDDFLLFYFKSPVIKSALIKVSRGVRQANISNEDIYKLRITLPSLDRQKKFVDVMNTVRSMKKGMKSQSEEMDANFNALMQGAFHNM